MIMNPIETTINAIDDKDDELSPNAISDAVFFLLMFPPYRFGVLLLPPLLLVMMITMIREHRQIP
jgi:hypothetical protein